MKIKTFGEVKNGKLVLYHRNDLSKALQSWDDAAVEVNIKTLSKGRSTPQNRYYFAVVAIVKDAFWEQHGIHLSSEQVHDFLKIKFNSIEVFNDDGVVEKIPLSTTELDTVEFEVYLEQIRQWALDFLNIRIGLPNEQTEIFN